MSADITGTQSHMTHERDPLAQSEEAKAATIEPGREVQELTPDEPPRAIDDGDSKSKRPRGFAAMDRKVVSEIARKGGKAAHSAGTAHEFTSEEARVAGRKGGRATHAKRKKEDEPQSRAQSTVERS